MNLFNRQTFFAAVVTVLCSLNPPPAQAIRPVDESVLPLREPANGMAMQATATRSKLLRPFIADELDVQPSQENSANLVAQVAKPGVAAFMQRAGGTWEVTWDRRNDLPNLIQGSGYPLVPGAGNNLSLPQLGLATAADVDLAAIEMLLEDFIQQNADLLGARGKEFRFDLESSGAYGKDNSHWFVEFEQFHNGVPVEGAHLFFRIVAGNIVQFGAEKVAPVLIDTTPSDEGIEALAKAMSEMFPADADIVQYHNVPELLLAPVLPAGESVKELFHGAAGTGYAHKLLWRYVFRIEGDQATYEVMVDAHTNRVVNVRDINRYIDARVSGGIYPTTNTDPIINVPLPYVSVTNGTTKITDLLGIYDWNGSSAGNATLNGQYFRMVDNCGSISLSSNTTDGNIAFGASGGTDCATPGFGGAGNTHSSRTGFYHLTNINRKAIKYLSGHTSSANWLNSKVTANMNIVDTCNAYWDGSTVNFFRSGGGCANTGELAAVFLHEWGHGMDAKSGGSASEYGSGEAVGDTFAFLETKDSCIGMNFLPTNCDNCSACTGVRDVGEFSNSGATHGGGTHTIARPSTVTSDTGINCDRWACPYSTSTGTAYRGPMGYEGHCESYIASSANWDLTQALIDTYGPSQGWQEMDRIWYGSLVASKSAYQVASGGTCNANATVNGCGASNWYTVFLAADDNDGNLANGTPNACRIWDAFDAHGIACGTRPVCTPVTDFTLDIPQTSQSVCRPDSATYTVNVDSLGGFGSSVTLAASGLPAGITASFSPATVMPGNSSVLTVTAGAGVDAFPYTINVNGTAAGSAGRTATTKLVVNEPLAAVALSTPADYSVNVSTSTSLSWAPANNVTGYVVQVATDPGFSNVVWTQVVTTPTAKPTGLAYGTRYYWRVKAQNVCGDVTSTAYTFVTAAQASVLLVDDSHGGGTLDKWTTPLNVLLGAGSYNIRDTSVQGEPASAAELAPYKTIVWFSGGVYGGAGSYVAGPNPTSETLLGNWLDGGACYFISSQDYRYDRNANSTFMTNYLGATVADQDVSATSQTGLNIYSGVNANISASTAGFQLYPDQLTVEAGAQSAYRYNTTAIDGVSKSVGGANPYFTTWLAFPLEGSSVANRQAVLQRFFDTCTYKSNKLPVAVNDAISVAQGGTATTLVGGATSVRANDTDAEDTVPGGDVTAYRLPANGTLTLNADGTFSYVHNGSATTSDSFTYYVKDSAGGISNAATVNITVTAPVNQPPTANSQNVSTAFNTPVAITLSGNDPDGDTLSFAIVTPPAHGTLSGVAPSLTYTPTNDYSGADSFTFTVSDGVATSAAATVSITVDEAPSYTVTAAVSGVGGTITPASQNVVAGSTASFTVVPDAGYDVDSISGDTCSVTQDSMDPTLYQSSAINADCAVTATFSSDLAPGKIVISQIFGNGGSASAAYNYDYFELFNSGELPVDIGGWTIQYGSYTGTGNWTVGTVIPAGTTIPPGKYFLIRGGSDNTGNGGALPTPDHVANGINFAANANGGKLALVSNNTALNGACPTAATIQDLVGTGNANCREGASTTDNAPVFGGAGNALFRLNGGCVDTDNNRNDFQVAAAAARNSASPAHTCDAVVTFTVTPSVGSGEGSITPDSPQSVESGETASFTLTPDTGYHIVNVTGTCGGSLAGNVFTTNAVSADCTVIANFAIDSFTVTASVSGSGGTISPASQSVDYGDVATFTVTPDAGYSVSVSGDTCSVTQTSGTTWTSSAITADCAVTASFSLDSFTVTASSNGNGTISPASQSVAYGGTATFTVTPSAGYHVDSVSGDTCTVTGTAPNYSAANITADCAVTASFALDSFTVTASVSGAGGTITPASQSVDYNGTATFTVTPNSGYHVDSVSGDTCTVTQDGETTTWTSSAITQACAVTATFALNAPGEFTPGNVVVYRVGDGVGTLASGVAAKVYLDEFDADTGALVQSIEMPTSADGLQNACTAAGTATSEGFISRSANGAYIIGTCYDASPATPSISASSSASINRVVFRVGADAVPDTITALSDFSNGGSPRSAASVNGTGLWMGGAGSPNSTRYVAYDAVTPPTTSAQLNTLNARVAQIYDGQLYVSVAAAINAVGTGLPTSGTQASTQVLSVSGGSIYGYYFADLSETEEGLDTLYVAQDNANALGKYSKVGGVWTQNTPAIGTNSDAYRGLVGVTNEDGSVTLYATRKGGSGAAGGGELVKIVDTAGYNAPNNGTPVVLAAASTNTAFRGVAFAPVEVDTYTVTPSVGTGVGTISPDAPQTVDAGQTVQFTLTPGTGHHIVDVTGTCGGELDGNVFTTDAVDADCTVIANFAIDVFTVTASSGGNGTITPSSQSVDYGGTASFVVTPATGYHVVSVVGDACTVTGSAPNYSAANVTADCAVVATFANDVPTATAQSVSTPEDTALTITLGGTDTDGSIASYAVVTQPANGTLSGTAPNLTYTPNANYFGADSFTFTVTDNGGATSPAATVSITVNPVNDAPVFESGAYAFSTVEAAPVGHFVGKLLANDVEGDAVSYAITGGNTGNAFQINPATGVITVLTPASLGAPGTIFTLTVAASDASDSGTATVTIEILDVDLFKDGFED
mgnify:CR=1 FL=1